jgi:hypothetical protein
MVARNSQDCSLEQLQNSNQQSVGVVSRPMEQVAENRREQTVLAGIRESPSQLVEYGLRVVVFPETWSPTRQMGITDAKHPRICVRHKNTLFSMTESWV